MDLHAGLDRGVDVVSGRFGHVVDLNRMEPPRHREQRRVIEVLHETRRVERGTHDDALERGALLEDLLEEAEEDVRLQRALVRLVEDDDRVARKLGVGHRLSEEHTVGHILEPRALPVRVVVETNGVAHLLA